MPHVSVITGRSLVVLSYASILMIFRFIRIFAEWPECECIQARYLSCGGASYSLTYPAEGEQGATLMLDIPALVSADPGNWALTVSLSLTDPVVPISLTSPSLAVTLSLYSSSLSIRPAVGSSSLPSDGVVRVSISLAPPHTVAKWKYPCVTDISCNIPHPPVTDLVGSIIISSLGLAFILCLIICVKTCHYRAKRNDQLRVRRLMSALTI